MADANGNGNGSRFVTWAMVAFIAASVAGTATTALWFSDLWHGLDKRLSVLESRFERELR